jgi:hypothetical protein
MKRVVTGLAAVVVLALVMAVVAACPATPPTTPPSTSPPATGGGLKLEVTPVTDGKAAQPTSVTATTTPGATLTIEVTNPKTGNISSYPTEKTKTAGADGKVVWTWNIPKYVAKGTGEIKVTAKLGGDEIMKTVAYTIIESEY